jgi:hypothetical protein
MLTAEDILAGTFVVKVGGLPGHTDCFLAPDGDSVTAHIAEAGRWKSLEWAKLFASLAIESWGEAGYWIAADPVLASEVV